MQISESEKAYLMVIRLSWSHMIKSLLICFNIHNFCTKHLILDNQLVAI